MGIYGFSETELKESKSKGSEKPHEKDSNETI